MRRPVINVFAVVVFAMFGSFAANSQILGHGQTDDFLDKSVLQPAPGAAASIIVFEDMGCGGCAFAHSKEVEAARKAQIPLRRFDFPIKSHVWTYNAAVWARFVERKYGAAEGEEFRASLFNSLQDISTKSDLDLFVQHWFKQKGIALPSVLDPDGSLLRLVEADYAVGAKLGVTLLPTIVVVTRDAYQVVAGGKSGTVRLNQLGAIAEASKQIKPGQGTARVKP